MYIYAFYASYTNAFVCVERGVGDCVCLCTCLYISKQMYIIRVYRYIYTWYAAYTYVFLYCERRKRMKGGGWGVETRRHERVRVRASEGEQHSSSEHASVWERGGEKEEESVQENERGRVCVVERGVHRRSEREGATDRKEKKSEKNCARRDLKEGERGGRERKKDRWIWCSAMIIAEHHIIYRIII